MGKQVIHLVCWNLDDGACVCVSDDAPGNMYVVAAFFM